LRVGFYTPNYPGLTGEGGIGTYVRAVAHGLAALGHTPVVLAEGDRPPTADGPVRIHFTPTRHLPGIDKLLPGAGACWRVNRAARRLVRDERLDLFEFPNWEGFGLLFARTARTPTVVRLHTSSAESQVIDGRPPSRWDRWNVRRERLLSHAGTAVVTHSNAHRQTVAAEAGLNPATVRVIPHGVEAFPDFARSPRLPGPLRVVYLGRLEHRKGTVELLQAIPHVLREVPDAAFTLIGSDRPHAPGGRTHAAYLAADFPEAVRRRVTLTGPLPQPEVDRHLQTADLFVAPSRYESFGLIFLEAMRWGTPVVGTTAGGIPEVVAHGETGWLVPAENPPELAAAIVKLLRDEELRAKLGAAGRASVERNFTVARMAESVAELYRAVIVSRGGRG
jgi:glycogen(starch) synthase